MRIKINESYEKHWFTVSNIEPPLAWQIRTFLGKSHIRYDELFEDPNYSFDINCTDEEYSYIRSLIDDSDWSYITRGNHLKSESVKYRGRYFVANEDCIPFGDQPENGYTAMGAVERAQREAERASSMSGEPISETRTWFRILDSDFNTCPELEKGI